MFVFFLSHSTIAVQVFQATTVVMSVELLINKVI